MTKDKRAEIVEAMARQICRWSGGEYYGQPNDDIWGVLGEESHNEFRLQAKAAIDLVLEEAAKVARGRVVYERFRTWDFWPVGRDGERGNCSDDSVLARHGDDIADAIVALTSKGTPND